MSLNVVQRVGCLYVVSLLHTLDITLRLSYVVPS